MPPADESVGFEKAQARLRTFAAVVSPSIVGVAVIVCVLIGEPSGTQLSQSEIVSSVALLVGAALVLGSIALYLRSPTEYDRLQLTHAEQLQAVAQVVAPIVVEQIKGQRQPAVDAAPAAVTPSLPPASDPGGEGP